MLCDSYFKNPKDAPLLLEKIRACSEKSGPIRLMEICGTHTMAIARSGLKSVLPKQVELLSGPRHPLQYDRYDPSTVPAARRHDHQLRRSSESAGFCTGRLSAQEAGGGRRRGIGIFPYGRHKDRPGTSGKGSRIFRRRL